MPDVSAFPVTAKWPAQHPERLQLNSLAMPNGVKVSFETNDQNTPEFLSRSRNNKIPAILDPQGPAVVRGLAVPA